MNIAVINIKDILKYILKIGAIVCLIYICMHLIGISKKTNENQNKIKETLEEGMQKINNYTFLDCLDVSMSLFSYKKTDNIKTKLLSSQDILAMGSGIFDKSILENTDLIINENIYEKFLEKTGNELSLDDAEELANQIEEIPKDATTEAVDENNITPKYTTTYGSVKINNQSKYDITEEILKPDIEITNKKDILIYHTHTCESYTPSKRL